MYKIIASIGLIQVAAIIVNIVRSKVTAVLLGPDGVGIISVVDQTVNLVLQVCSLSLPFASIKFLSRSHSRSRILFEQTYSNFLSLLLVVTVFGALAATASLYLVPDLLGSSLIEYRLFLLIGFATIPVMSLQGYFKHTIAAAAIPRGAASYDVAIAIFLTTGVIAGISVSGIKGYYIGLLASGVLLILVTTRYLHRTLGLRIRGSFRTLKREFRDNPDIVPFTAVMYVSTFMTPLAMLIARYAVLRANGEVGAGLLHAGFSIALALSMLLAPTNGLYLTPIVNRDIPGSEKVSSAMEYQYKLLLAAGILAAPLVLFPKVLLSLLFSPSFIEAFVVVKYFVIAQVILLMVGVFTALLIGLGRIKMFGIVSVAGQAAFGVLAWYLVPEYGLHGVAYGFIAANLLMLLSAGAYLNHVQGMQLTRRMWTAFGYIVFLLYVMGTVAEEIEFGQTATVAFRLVLLLLFGSSLYFVFLTSDERSTIRLALSNLFRR